MGCSMGETGTERECEGKVGRLAVRKREPLLGPGSVADTMPVSRVSPALRCLPRCRWVGWRCERRDRCGEPGGVQGISMRRRLEDGWPSQVRGGMKAGEEEEG